MRRALQLEALTLAWMILEAGCSIYAGLASHSLLLVAFGADSVIELVSAILLLWRLKVEQRSGSTAEVAKAESLATKCSGYLLYLLSIYVCASAVFHLQGHRSAEGSGLGLFVAVAAALAMPVLAREKIRVAEEIGSKALRADAMQTFTCGYLSWVLLVGMAGEMILGWWWVDGLASLVLVPFLLREAREAAAGGCSCSSGCHP